MAEEIQIATILECFSGFAYPRKDWRRCHKLLDVVIGLCTIISGGEGFTDMEGLIALSRI